MVSSNPVIIISRTDSIGDVVLTLPMAGVIKKQLPGSRIIFLGRSYTRDVIALSEHVDEFINYDEIEKLEQTQRISTFRELKADCILHVLPNKQIAYLAKKSQVPLRIGTTNRIYHWWTCNKLIRLSRKNSSLHEAQLNLKLLTALKIPCYFELDELAHYYGFTRLPQLNDENLNLIDKNKYKVILHPKSKGSAKEWGIENFEKLLAQLKPDKYQVFVSGTSQDAIQMQDFLQRTPGVINLTGKLTLSQFIAFIHHCDALVAASTGPLHIAAALNKTAIGLFSPKRPIHPGRWKPLGKKAHYLVFDENCEKCRNGQNCDCIKKITPQQIVDLLNYDRL